MLEGTPDARNLNQPVVFNPGQPRAPYRDSLSLSTGLWELRDMLGRPIVDGWVVQSLLNLRASPHELQTFGLRDAVLAAIRVDEAINAGANVAAIEDMFIQRGIL